MANEKQPSVKTKRALQQSKEIHKMMVKLDEDLQIKLSKPVEEMKVVAVIGDLTVKVDSEFVSVSVDDDIVLLLDRDKQYGLGQLVEALQKQMK